MTSGTFRTGELGYILAQVETVPGSKPGSYAPDAVLWETNGLDSVQTVERKVLAANSRNGQRLAAITYFDNGGPIMFPKYPNSGACLDRGLLGQDVPTTVTTDAVKSATPVVTAAGISTITVTTGGAGKFLPGAWIKVNTGTSAELRQVVSYDGTSVITCAALVINAAAAPAVAVVQPVQHHFYEILANITGPPALNVGNLPTYYIENCMGGRPKSEIYANSLIGKLDLKFDEHMLEATYAIDCINTRPTASTATAFSASSADLLDPMGPFTGPTMQFVTWCDPLATGTGSLRGFLDIETVDASIDNGIKKKNLVNRASPLKFPTTRLVTAKTTYSDESDRSVEYEDLINTINAQDGYQPFIAGAAINQNTAGSPTLAAYGIYIANAKCTAQKRRNATGDILGMEVDWDAVPDVAGDHLVDIWLLNATNSAY